MNTKKTQRKHQRYPCIVPVCFKTATLKNGVTAHMTNFSEGGICLDADLAISVGTEIHVRIEDNALSHPDFHPFNLYPTRVCWHSKTIKNADGRYTLGLQYVD